MAQRDWNVIDEERGILWHEYAFRSGAYATTLVFRGADGLVVISPGRGLTDADFAALARFGEVRALVANNSLHHLGQAEWRARFPKAQSYAAAAACPQLAKRAPGVPFRPLDELALPPHVRWHALPGFKTGELLFSVGSARGTVWYTGDLLTNLQGTPPPLRWLFTWTNSAPGFRLFRIGVIAFVKDKRALRERALQLLAEDPPAIVVPAHGPAVTATDLVAQARTQLERL